MSVSGQRFSLMGRWFLVAVFLLVLGFFLARGVQHYEEYRNFMRTEAALQDRLNELSETYRLRQRYYQRLQNDPAFLEDVVRDRLGYIRAGEAIFRFPSAVDEE